MDFHDPVSSGTHLFTAAWAFFAMLVLVRLANRQSLAVRCSLIAFGLSMVVLYLASGFYHGLRFDSEDQRLYWLRMDRSAIFLLILGSQLPIFAAFLAGWRRTISIGVASTIAIVGMIYQWLDTVSQGFAIASYVGMGAVGALTVPWWVKKVGWDGMKWLVTATSLYVAGAAVEAMKWPIPLPGIVGHHELLHIFDTVASLIHFGFVVRFVVIPVTTAAESYDSPVETTSSEPALCLPAATTSAIT